MYTGSQCQCCQHLFSIRSRKKIWGQKPLERLECEKNKISIGGRYCERFSSFRGEKKEKITIVRKHLERGKRCAILSHIITDAYCSDRTLVSYDVFIFFWTRSLVLLRDFYDLISYVYKVTHKKKSENFKVFYSVQ